MAAWLQDLTHWLRRLLKSPGFFVAAVVISIGLGIAANAAIFSIVSRFVLRSAPVREPVTLLALHTTDHVTFTAVPILLAAIAFLACWLPSRRAATIDPQIALRYETA